MALAREEALRLERDYIDTEHILLGIIRQQGGLVIPVLTRLGCDSAAIRSEIEKLSIPSGSSLPALKQLPFSPGCKRVIELAVEEQDKAGQSVIDTQHLLLGLLREHDGMAARVLTDLGLSSDKVRETIVAVISSGSAPDSPSPHSGDSC
jgi:ATP-dependent Clp protease ATP-binding subunit ClpC